MKVVVFGGSGFLGSHTADSLTEAGYDVMIFDIKKTAYLKPNQKMLVGDILDKDAVYKAVSEADFVFNFAGISDLDDAADKPLDTIKHNILGTCLILDACVKYKIKRFIYASSIYVHSDKGGFYRCSKQAAELYIEEYYEKYRLPYTVLRYGTIYGPRADEKNSIFRYIKQALENNEIIYRGTGEEKREYVHVKDAADLAVKSLGEEFRNKHIIITGHHAMRSKDMLRMLQEILGNTVKITYQKKKISNHYNVTPYTFQPKYNFKLTNNYYRDMGYGLLETIDYVHSFINQVNS